MHIYSKFETYNFQSKNLAHKGVDFYVQNALKLALRASVIPNNFPGVIPPDPRERGGKGTRRKTRGAERRESRGEGLHHGCWGDRRPWA